MTPPPPISVPDLDSIDEAARHGENVDASEVLRLTRALRRLVQLVIDAGGGGLIVKDSE